jgi:glycosyltransferase involved in cell wall biosynthesis
MKEWIIVEGSQDIELQKKNILQIQDFINEKKDHTDIDLRFIIPSKIYSLSDLRNIGNDNCTGEIIVCMDDDDYYPPTRVSHAVKMLNQYNRLIAGCSAMYMYDFTEDKFYKFHGYHNDHSTNNCMAYKKEYLQRHRYAEGLTQAEENSFTNGFTEPMVQLNPEHCIVVSSHGCNTVEKSPSLTHKYICEIPTCKIRNIIPMDIFERMKLNFSCGNNMEKNNFI